MAPYLYHKIPGEWKRRGFYTDILIDEGAQTREPETVGPLSLAAEVHKDCHCWRSSSGMHNMT